MFTFTQGELLVLLFMLFAVLSARYWPRLGGALGRWFAERAARRA
jgi:hypothetical protein